MKESKILYSFNWVGGGYNQVWADSIPESKDRIREEFTDHGFFAEVIESSFKRYETKEEQSAYWKSLGTWD